MQGADEIEQKSSTVANEEESKCVLEIVIINIIFVIIRHVRLPVCSQHYNSKVSACCVAEMRKQQRQKKASKKVILR